MNSSEKLQNDLKVLDRFSRDLSAYLESTTLFYPTGPNYPQLTVGGLLMRQHRLLLCRSLLSQAERNELNQTIASFQAALEGNIVRFESKAHKELQYRLKQWRERIRDLVDSPDEFTYYQSGVEPRLMLAAILQQLALPPFQLDSDVPERLEAIDLGLRARWISGDFVLQEGLEPAYPKSEYWYLYGEVAQRPS